MTMTAPTNIVVPAYLSPVTQANHFYGKLSYDKDSKSWVIHGEPSVVEMAKRLFPGCSGRGQGIARFKANKRVNGDLNWLMMRFPLEIEDPELWEEAYAETVEHVIKREEINKTPMRVKPMKLNTELRAFQEEGVGFLLHNRRTLLADDMGLGKTIQALGFLSETESYPALVVCQPHLISNFKKEITRFLDAPLPSPEPTDQIILFDPTEIMEPEDAIHVIRGRKNYELPNASIYMIHYGLIASWRDAILDLGIQTVIFDEIQDLRHTGTQKYSASSVIAEQAENVIGLSGTPIYNRGGEIWAITNILDFQCLGDWESFTREWCDGYGNDTVDNPTLLGDYLKREGLLLRRKKDDVLDDLPPKRRVVQTIDFDKTRFDELIQEAMDKAVAIESVSNVLERGRMTRDIVNDTRQATGIAKAPYVAQFVQMLLEAGEPVLLFAWHRAVFDIYMEALKQYAPVKLTGAETSKQKDEAVRKFMEGETNILMISLRASAGLNLQRARVVVFGELDWSPAIHSQAEDRAHRMGQNDSVLAYYLVSETGSDEDVQEALGLKVSQFTGLMGDAPETEEDRMLGGQAATEHMNKIVQKLRKRAKPH